MYKVYHMCYTAPGASFEHPLLAGLSGNALSALRSQTRKLSVAESSDVFLEGSTVDGLYVLTRGLIKITRISIEGDQQLIDILGAGEVVGELALYDDGPRSATATTLVPCEFEYIPRTIFFDLADQHPEIYRSLLKALSTRLRETNHSFARNQFLPVSGQVAAVLIRLAGAMGEMQDDSTTIIDNPITHKEIASMIGAARENVSRILGQLKKQGVIDSTRNRLILKEMPHLESMAQI